MAGNIFLSSACFDGGTLERFQVDADNFAKMACFYRTCKASDDNRSTAASMNLIDEASRVFALMDALDPA